MIMPMPFIILSRALSHQLDEGFVFCIVFFTFYAVWIQINISLDPKVFDPAVKNLGLNGIRVSWALDLKVLL